MVLRWDNLSNRGETPVPFFISLFFLKRRSEAFVFFIVLQECRKEARVLA